MSAGAEGTATAGERRRIVVAADGRLRRADRYVADVTGLSRAYVQRLIAEGRLSRDGRPIKANAVLEPGDVLELEVPPARRVDALTPAPEVPVTVVYEDEDLLIVDKPAGLVVHPAPGHHQGTLVQALLARQADLGGIAGVLRPGIVHRLDRETSGLLVVAKHDAAQISLMAQFRSRRVKKTYLALVAGDVAAASGRIEAPIGRHPAHRTMMAVVEGGRPAVTAYRVQERLGGWTLVEVDLITGRTHQIRVHLAAIGHPVAGDAVYGTGSARTGPEGLNRLFLHSWRLEFVSPSRGELIRAVAPLPVELEKVLHGLRRRAQGIA